MRAAPPADGAWLALGAAGALALAAGLRGSAATRYPYTDSLINTWALITVSPRRIESVEVWAEEDDAREEARARHVEHRLCRPPAVAPIASGHDWLVVRIFPNGHVSGTSYPTLLEAKREASGLWQMHESERAAGRRSLYDLAIYRLGDETGTRVADPSTGFLPRITDAIPPKGSSARTCSTEGGLAALGEPWPPGLHVIILYDSYRIVRVEVHPTAWKARATSRVEGGRLLRSRILKVPPDGRFLALVLHRDQPIHVLGTGQPDLGAAKHLARRADSSVFRPEDLAVYEVTPSGAIRVADRTIGLLPRITDVPR